MRLTVSPPEDTTLLPRNDARVVVEVRLCDPTPYPTCLGPLTLTYEGRYEADNTPSSFVFPVEPAPSPALTTSPAFSDFRLPPLTLYAPYLEAPIPPASLVTVETTAANGTPLTASAYAPSDTAPDLNLQLQEGTAAPQPNPNPTPSAGLTITPDDIQNPTVLTLDPAPGNDTIVIAS